MEQKNKENRESSLLQQALDYLHKNVSASIVYEDFHDFSKGIKGAEVDYFPETAEELLLEMGIKPPQPNSSIEEATEGYELFISLLKKHGVFEYDARLFPIVKEYATYQRNHPEDIVRFVLEYVAENAGKIQIEHYGEYPMRVEHDVDRDGIKNMLPDILKKWNDGNPLNH